jgi:pyruvate dehydrogenase E2 component (dihydrolipoamide acetyltransferase)
MTTIKMPQLGETIIEGTILKWLKGEGEAIERDEPLFEISTDKVDTEVPSPVNGTVSKILVEEGQTVPVGTDLAEIAEEGAAASDGDSAEAAPVGGPAPATEEASSGISAGTEPPSEAASAPSTAAAPSAATSEAPAAAESASAVAEGSAAEMPAVEPATPQGAEATAASATSPAPSPSRTGSGDMPDRGPRSRILSPLVRRLADEHGLDLSRIEGSGTGGRITKQDVMAAIDSGGAAAPVAAGAAPATAPAPADVTARAPAEAPAAPAPTVPSVQPAAGGPGDEVVPITHIRKAIGQHMIASLQTSARAWTMVEVNIDHLVKLRERAKEPFKAKHGVNLTYLPFVIRATCDALLTHPEVNAELRGDQVVMHRYVNMGIAVSYDAGLIVPVVKGADAMNTVGLARAIADLAARARAHQLKPDEVQGSTFTITNPGPYGSIASLPIINQPNAGILSLDAIQKRPVVIDDTIAIRSMVNISMSWDHRTIDGEIATRFLARVKQNLESWDFAEDVAV